MAGAPQGYIGRNPSDGRTSINRQRFTVATGVQTSFTFTTGYDLGYLDVYLNGIRQVESLDYSADDGSTFSFGVSTPAVQGDTVEAVAYKSFNTTNVTGSTRDFSVGRNLDVTGNVTIGSSLTIASDLVVNGTYTYVNTEVLEIEDKTVGIASTSAASNTTADGAGIVVYGGAGGDKSLLWDKDLSNWVLSGGGISLGTGVTISTPAANVLAFSIDGAVNAKLNNFGAFIVGDGVDGEAWANAYKAVQVGSGGFIGQAPGASASSYWTNNAYFDSVNSRWEYIAADEATKLESTDGVLTWMNASAGSADGAITWSERLRVDASGNLSLAGDGNTYIGHPSPDVLAVTAAGSEVLRVSTAGGVVTGILTATSFSGPFSGTTGTFTGDVSIADKIVHIGDTNTALRFPAADTITAETGGSERLRITSAGKIGINSTAPADLLTINAGANALAFGGRDTNRNNHIWQMLNNDNEGNAELRMYKNSVTGTHAQSINFATSGDANYILDGNFGLGTASPTSFGPTFQVSGTDPALLLQDTATAVDYFGVNVAAGAVNTWYDDAAAFTISTATGIAGSGLVERLRIDNAGRLLIGATANNVLWGVSAALQVEGTSYDTSAITISRNTNDSGGAYLILGKSRGTSDGSHTIVQSGDTIGSLAFAGADGGDQEHTAAYIQAAVDGTPGSNDMPGRLTFFTTADGAASGTERLRIDSAGAVFVGGNGASATSGALWFNDTSAYSSKIAQVSGSSALTFHTGSSQPERLRITSAGYVQVRFTQSATTGGAPLYVGVTGKSSITYGGGQNDTACVRIEDEGSSNSYYHGIELRTKQGGDARIYAQDKGSDKVDLCFATDNNALVERLRVASNGVITSTYPTVTVAQDTNVDDVSGDRFEITLPDNSRMFRIQGSFSFAGTETYRIWGDMGEWSDGHSTSMEGFANWWEEGAAGPTYQDNISGRYFEVADPVDSQCCEVTYDIVVTTMAFFNGGSENQGGGRPGVSGTIRWTRQNEGNALTIFSYQDTSAKATDRLLKWAWDIDHISGTLGAGKHHYVVQALPLTGDAQNLGDAA